MNKEIELKAHVDDPELIKQKLISLYGKAVPFDKDDVYYNYRNAGESDYGQPVRLRAENGKNVVTLKRKSVDNGIESNDELEFEVDNPDNFIKFLQLSGAEPWLAKKKRGCKFSDGSADYPAVIELCEVEGLGWFLEIEVVTKKDDESGIAAARERILAVLEATGIGEEKIEPRFYSDMLLNS